MRTTRRILAILLLSTAPAFAQAPPLGPEPAPAGTAEGAKALIEDLVPYVGRGAFDNGALKVEPDPAGYRLTIDPKPFIDAMKSGEATVSVSPYSVVLSRRDDGTWNTFADSKIDIAVGGTINGVKQDIVYDIGPQRFKGVYSPAIAAFLSGTGSIDRMRVKASEPESDIAVNTGRGTFDLTGAPAAGGGADATVKQVIEGFDETVAVRQGGDAPPDAATVEIKAAKAESDIGMKALRSRQLADLYGFFVAHPEYAAQPPDTAKLAASQDDLKSRARAALPLWNNVAGGYILSGIQVGTAFGSAKVDSLAIAMTADGVSRAGTFTYAFGYKGFSVASPAIPNWAGSLIPGEADLRFKVDNLDLQTPADILLADLDFARTEPVSADAQKRIGDAFAANPPRFVMEPSRLVARDYDLAVSGSVVVQNDRPALTMDISAGGIEKAIATLQAAAQTQPEINQAVGALSMAKGFGKTLPDGRTQWIVDASSDGSVKVNGFQVKAADPVGVAPDDGDDADGDAPDDQVPPGQAPTDDNALPDSQPQ